MCFTKYEIMKEFDDNSIMPFGKHRGEKLANVPAEYLIYMYDEGRLYGGLKQYVDDNMQSLRQEIKLNQK